MGPFCPTAPPQKGPALAFQYFHICFIINMLFIFLFFGMRVRVLFMIQSLFLCTIYNGSVIFYVNTVFIYVNMKS